MDEFGNITARTRTAGGGGNLPQSMALAVSAATNRLAGAGFFYDVLGNLVTMPAGDGAGTVSMAYLDQGHIGTLTDAAGNIWKYYYDANGKRRIKAKTAGGAATEPDGQGGVRLVADRSFYFYEGEDLICQQDVGDLVQDESQYEPKFLLLDHLGTTRAELVFDPSTLAPQIQEYYDLMPYGEVIDPPTTPESVLFTGKPRDFESDLDYFGARYYSDQLCRWPSPDPYLASGRVSNPQSWNRYSYCLHNPTNFIDPKGLWAIQYQDETNKKGELKSRKIMLSKSKQGDDAASLVKQLGIDPNSKRGTKLQEKINKQIGSGDGVQASKLGGMIGRVFGAAEQGMTAQAKWAAEGNTQGGPSMSAFNDCSMTACRIAYPMDVSNAGSWNVYQADAMIKDKGMASSDGTMVGDMVRFADQNNSPKHFMTVLYNDDAGVTFAFSRNGVQGSFTISPVPSSYNTPRSSSTIKGIAESDSGFYRPSTD
jgi:RHS repeat-associated protein